MLFINSKSVKYQELLVAVILSKTFYKDTNLYVGDKEKVTDIYCRSKRIGIEVVQSEYLSDFLLDSYSKLTQKDNTLNLSSSRVSKKTKVLSWSYNTDFDDEYIMSQFRERVNSKLTKLQKGNYSKIKGEVNLALLSYLRVKDKSDAKNFISVYKKERLKFERGFDKIFLIFSTGAYYIMDDNIVAEVEFVGEEFLEYQKIARSIIAESKKQVL